MTTSAIPSVSTTKATAVATAATIKSAAAAAIESTAAAAAAAAAAFAESTAARLTLFGLTDTDWATLKFRIIQTIDCCLTLLLIRHFDESKATGAARVTIHYYAGRFYFTKSGESILKVFVTNFIGQISYIDIHYSYITEMRTENRTHDVVRVAS